MLISYKFRNYCSFCEMAEFDMLAPANKVKNRFPDNFIETEEGYDILKTAVIIGENAGGKTNFINSLSFLKAMFEDNRPKHAYKSLINFNHLCSQTNPSEYDTMQEFDICIMGESKTIYHYNLQIDEFGIVKEELSYKNVRKGQEKTLVSAQRCEASLRKEEHVIDVFFIVDTSGCSKEVDRMFGQMPSAKGEKALFISKLAILGESRAREFVDWINDKLVVESRNYNYSPFMSIQNEEEELRVIKDFRFLEILRMVDYSICGIEVDDEKPFSESVLVRRTADGKEFSREISRDSGGIREFFAWAVQLFRVVYEDKTIFADEMDRVINPILSERIVAYINGKTHKGQFVFSSHNALHLNLKNYMKEQIYFVTKKRDDLNSELYSLADFPEIRYETTKIYEFYMKGILGGTAFEQA